MTIPIMIIDALRAFVDEHYNRAESAYHNSPLRHTYAFGGCGCPLCKNARHLVYPENPLGQGRAPKPVQEHHALKSQPTAPCPGEWDMEHKVTIHCPGCCG